MGKLRFSVRAGMVVLGVFAPHKLARLMLRPYVAPPGVRDAWPGKAEEIAFPSHGGALCRGWMVTPAGGATDAGVVLAHGWGSHALRMQMWVPVLLERGYPVMLYDARGHGRSDPTEFCSLRQFSEDVVAAVTFARSRWLRVAMLGHSLGAGATILAAAGGSAADAAVCLAAPAHPAAATRDLLVSEGVPADLLMRRVGPLVQQLLGRTFDSLAPEQRIREVPCPVLLLHGGADEVIPPHHFDRLRQAAGPNVQGELFADLDHHTIRTDPRVQARVTDFLVRALPPVRRG